MLTLYVCTKTASLATKETIKLDLNQQDDSSCDLNNKLTVDNLMAAIKKKLSLPGSTEDYQLVCLGRKLKGDKLLSSYGIKSNSVVHLFFKSAEERSANNKMDLSEPKGKGKKAKFDQTDIHNMVIASRTALMNKSFRQMLARLHETDFRNNLIQCTPGLKDDLIAIAVLHDAEVLSMFMESNSIEKVLEKHPAILEAATHLATAFHEENAMSGSRSLPTEMAVDSSPFVSYSLDDLSEDDEMTGGVDAPPPNGQHVMSPTTASAFAHLIRAQVMARRRADGSSQNPSSFPPPPPMTLPPNHTPQQIQQLQLAQLQQLNAQHQLQQQQQQQNQQNQQQQSSQSAQQQNQLLRQPENAYIAFEMLRHALQLTEPSTSQQGTNSNQPSASNPLSGQPNTVHQPPPPPTQPDMSRQIAQMRELGLTDEAVCLQALMATNGDVQAAVELIFSDTFQS